MIATSVLVRNAGNLTVARDASNTPGIEPGQQITQQTHIHVT